MGCVFVCRNTALPADTLDGQCLGRQIKKEKVTPDKRVSVGQSQRRSPSPVPLRHSPKTPTDRSQGLSSLGTSRSNSTRKSENEKILTPTVKEEPHEDSELSIVYEKGQDRNMVSKDLEKEVWSSKKEKTDTKKTSRLSLKKTSPHKDSSSQASTVVKSREKRKIIVEDSDDDDLPAPSSKRSRNQVPLEQEEDLFEVRPSQSGGAPAKGNTDLFEVSPQHKESRGDRGRAWSEERGSDEDLFNVGLPEGSPEKSTRKSLGNPGNSRSPEKTVLSKNRGGSGGRGNGETVIKEEISEVCIFIYDLHVPRYTC